MGAVIFLLTMSACVDVARMTWGLAKPRRGVSGRACSEPNPKTRNELE